MSTETPAPNSSPLPQVAPQVVPQFTPVAANGPSLKDIQNLMGDAFLDILPGATPPPQIPQMQPPPHPADINIQVKQQIDSQVKEPLPEDPLPSLLETPPAAPPPQEALVDTSDEEFPDPIPTSPEDKNPLYDNFKKVKTAFRETKKTLAEKEAEAAALKARVEKYESGEEYPEIITTLKAEAERGSYYEKLHNLKGSREYKTAFIEPLNQRGTELKQKADEYGIPENVMFQALALQGPELNRFLSHHMDDLGALETKQIVMEMQQLQTEAQEAEKEPTRHFEELQRSQAEIHRRADLQRVGALEVTAKEGWVNALKKIRTEGFAEELIYREGDSRHNKEIVKPFLDTAVQNFNTEMRAWAESGATHIPANVATEIARLHLLAVCSASALLSRGRAVDQADAIRRNTERENAFLRPQPGTTGGGGGGSYAPKKDLSIEDVTRISLSQAGVKI